MGESTVSIVPSKVRAIIICTDGTLDDSGSIDIVQYCISIHLGAQFVPCRDTKYSTAYYGLNF